MAKTRAQRKAERRAREAQQRQQEGGGDAAQESRAQHDTQTGVSGEVAEFEAAIDTQQNIPDDGQPVGSGGATAESAAPGVTPEPVQPPAPTPPAPAPPAPSRADAPAAAKEKKPTRREQRRLKKEEADKAKRQAESEARLKSKKKTAEQAPERRRGGVIAFFQSCWAELKRVQWPDRDTLVQASAVTLVFVAVMAAYLGVLDAAFNFLIKRII